MPQQVYWPCIDSHQAMSSCGVAEMSTSNKSTVQVWEFAHGQDSRLVEAPQARKSIGAQVYYGVRLDGDADADKFLDDLAGLTLLRNT